MRLDSVRELKAVLIAAILEPLVTAAARGEISVAAQPAAAVVTPRTIALGVARRGRADFRLAVRVQRRALEEGRPLDAIRRRARGEVDVRYIGKVVKRALPWHRRRNRPLRIGSSIGHHRVTAGTLGAFVRRRTDGAVLLLSANHVLADENRGRVGDLILQPGRHDGGREPDDTVAALARFVRLRRGAVNRVDCAVATVAAALPCDAVRLRGLGALAGASDAVLDAGLSVAKIGRTSGLTRGRVTAFELDNVTIAYDLGNLRFDDQIEIEGTSDALFSDGGDSGALIVDDAQRGVALLHAGSDQGGVRGRGLTFASPLGAVLEALGVDLLH